MDQLSLNWKRLMTNLGPAVCDGCRCFVPIDFFGNHSDNGVTYPCQAKNMREYLQKFAPSEKNDNL